MRNVKRNFTRIMLLVSNLSDTFRTFIQNFRKLHFFAQNLFLYSEINVLHQQTIRKGCISDIFIIYKRNHAIILISFVDK